MTYPQKFLFDSINKIFEAERKKIWKGVKKEEENTCSYCGGEVTGDNELCADCLDKEIMGMKYGK